MTAVRTYAREAAIKLLPDLWADLIRRDVGSLDGPPPSTSLTYDRERSLVVIAHEKLAQLFSEDDGFGWC